MKKTVSLYALSAAMLFVSASSCIQEEALNAEADILTVEFPAEIIESAPVVDNYSVTVRIKPDEDISSLAPVFTITEGATITPASGTVHDFLNAPNHTIYYTVTSEDGQWSKKYPVRVSQKEIPSEYRFNGCLLDPNNKYYIFAELDDTKEPVMTWATGNPGYVMSGMAKDPTQFPSVPIFSGNDKTKADYIRLETRSTGTFGKIFKMPIAAGNLFQGVFELAIATTDPRGATKFGETYRYKPSKLSGRYRYKAGEVYTDEKGDPVAGKKDMFSIYAVFFITDEKTEYLDGNIHNANFRHPNLLRLAMLDNPQESDEWISFEVPFDQVGDKTIDDSLLAQGKYKVGIVISSSVDGDYFKGAVGSTLDIADIKIEHEQQNTTEQ